MAPAPGARVALAATRRGSGPLLVCHPGGPGMDPRYLEPLDGLADSRTVAIVHPRGAGRSPRPPDGDYALESYAADLAAWIRREAGGRPVDLLGHSHGGAVASLTAARYPELVRSLVLLGTPAYGGERAEKQAEAFQDARRAEPAVARALAALEAQGDAYPEDDADLGRLIAEVIPLWVGPMTDGLAAWQSALAGRPANVDALRYFNETVFPVLDREMAHLPDVRCPTLALAGDLDGWAGPEHIALLTGSVPFCTGEVVAGSGHMCHADATADVLKFIRAFLYGP
ncbi:alpha/beta hydrolase [Streptomyces katrae]|uniref:Alpha/beta hydrolase n=1 Tax=Streptomyces katrae TaxID=68223 RepID=A0ABT7H187_9ACTN|nr:alpha/beta hydrolase [Streptomyces katrae]MDK9499259.1 alpha/beta hydrolase [Streptomyces katrae]